jgi:uncharacterized LabA/DUF88 family protein
MNGNRIAVYWDFENIHSSVARGAGSPSKPFEPQERVVNLEAVVDYLKVVGQVVINRAYGNWQWMGAYRNDLLNFSIDLVQLFPRGVNAKNGADIRLALDALEDAVELAHLSHVVIVAGDSDYISLAQKLQRLGKSVIGIGARASTNKYWSHACNEFKFYETLVAAEKGSGALLPEKSTMSEVSESDSGVERGSVSAGKRLLRRAMDRLLNESSDDYVLLSRIRPMMTRLDSEFDPANFNFPSMREFLRAASDVVQIKDGKADKLVYLTGGLSAETGVVAAPTGSARETLAEFLRKVLEEHELRRISKAKFQQLIAAEGPPLSRMGKGNPLELLSGHPDIEVGTSFVGLRELPQAVRQADVEAVEAPNPAEKKSPPVMEKAGRLDEFRHSLKIRGMVFLGPGFHRRVLKSIHEYGRRHEYRYQGPTSNVTGALVSEWERTQAPEAVTKTMMNRVTRSLLSSGAFIVEQEAQPGRWSWVLNESLRGFGSLVAHLEMYLLYLGIREGCSETSSVWSQFLYGSDRRAAEIDTLKARLLQGNYSAKFEALCLAEREPIASEKVSLADR